MASGPCLRRCRVVRRYMPIRLQFYRLDVKSYPSIHVSMYFESFWEGNAVNTGVPCLKVPMHRKLRLHGRLRPDTASRSDGDRTGKRRDTGGFLPAATARASTSLATGRPISLRGRLLCE